MKYFIGMMICSLAALILAACEGSDPDQTANAPKPENTVINEPVAEPSSANSAPDDSPPSEVMSVEINPSAEFSSLPAPYNTADYARGKRVFRSCSSCHRIGDGSSHSVGPDLKGLFGRTIGTVDGFGYSRPVLEAGFVWTPEQLDQWLSDPRGFLPGNRMTFQGVRKPEDRTAVIAYLLVETAENAE